MSDFQKRKINYSINSFPKVSVIIPSYNRFKYLLNAVESVRSQTYQNYEIIIVNDGSEEKDYYSYKFDKKTKVVNLSENQKQLIGFGPGSIRNFGTEIAEGEFLAFLDDDDIWMPEKLEIQLEVMFQYGLGFSSTEGYYGEGKFNSEKKYLLYNSEKYIEDIKYLYRNTDFIKNNKLPEIWDDKFSEIHNCFITSSVIVEKKLFSVLGGFRGLPRWADYDCWKGLHQLSDSIYIEKPLIYYDGTHADGRNYTK